MDVGVIAAGRIGRAVLRRLAPFDVRPALHRHAPAVAARSSRQLNVTFHPDVESLGAARSTWSPSIRPLSEGRPSDVQRAADRLDAARVLHRQHRPRRGDRASRPSQRRYAAASSAGYAGDVWFPQPPPADHPWRTMPNNAMTPHVSGTTLSAQARYAAGTREILESLLRGTSIRPEYLIVEGGLARRNGRHVIPEVVRRRLFDDVTASSVGVLWRRLVCPARSGLQVGASSVRCHQA